RARGEAADRPALIVERAPGDSPAARMQRTGARGGIAEIIAILTRLAAALAELHARGYIHGELTPEHVMIGPRGVRLVDFGRAGQIGGPADLRPAGHYTAPEQLEPLARIDPRRDLYTFGAI